MENIANVVEDNKGIPLFVDNTASECCDDPILFNMRDNHHDFAMGLCTIIQCIKIAEKMGYIPSLPEE